MYCWGSYCRSLGPKYNGDILLLNSYITRALFHWIDPEFVLTLLFNRMSCCCCPWCCCCCWWCSCCPWCCCCWCCSCWAFQSYFGQAIAVKMRQRSRWGNFWKIDIFIFRIFQHFYIKRANASLIFRCWTILQKRKLSNAVYWTTMSISLEINRNTFLERNLWHNCLHYSKHTHTNVLVLQNNNNKSNKNEERANTHTLTHSYTHTRVLRVIKYLLCDPAQTIEVNLWRNWCLEGLNLLLIIFGQIAKDIFLQLLYEN